MCLFTNSRSELFGAIKATLTMRLMMMKARSLHALNCRMNIVRCTWNCSLARTCSRTCSHIHIHKAFSEMFDCAWAVIPRTALEKLHNAAVKFVGSMNMMEKRAKIPHRPRIILCIVICMYRRNLKRGSIGIRTDSHF